MCILGKDVYITTTCNGFLNRDLLEKELEVSFKGKIIGIKNAENPYEVRYDNGVSILNLDSEHFEFIEKDKSVEEIKNNIKYVLLSKKEKTKLYIKGIEELVENTEKNRSTYKENLFLNYEEAYSFIEKNYLKDRVRIESYYVKDLEC